MGAPAPGGPLSWQVGGELGPELPEKRQAGGIERRIFCLRRLAGQVRQPIAVALGKGLRRHHINGVIVILAADVRMDAKSGGNKQNGMKLLREAGEADGETSVDAKVILALFLRREQRYREALDMVRSLTSAHPRNFLFALEVANILKDSGQGRESIIAYRKVLDSAKAGTYHDPHLEFAYWGLGEALRGQREFLEAASAYDAVTTFPHGDAGLLRRADLAAGEMYDVVLKRNLATQKYEAVITASADSSEADRARRHLRDPYKQP